MQLYFKESGRGQPVILLHGLFGSLDNWHTIAARLAEKFHVFALDQRNHGQSPHSAEMGYPLMAADVDEFFAARGLENAMVIGHSMGGKTAMQLALQFPHRVQKLVVADIAPRAYAPAHDKIFAAPGGLSEPHADGGGVGAGNSGSGPAAVSAEKYRAQPGGRIFLENQPARSGGKLLALARAGHRGRAIYGADIVHSRREIKLCSAGGRAVDPRMVSGGANGDNCGGGALASCGQAGGIFEAGVGVFARLILLAVVLQLLQAGEDEDDDEHEND
jgi:pimeloyl-ACP methyl ester carboxylesterase